MRKRLSLLFLVLIISFSTYSAEKVKFATSERVPYIGETLKDHGYVSELVIEAYKRAGYEVEIEFYPIARSILLAKQGKVDGVLPVYYGEDMKSDLEFSNPFPGDVIGLLKKIDNKIEVNSDPQKDHEGYLKELSQKKFGAVRGRNVTKEFDSAEYLKKDMAKEDYNNLMKLHAGRIDLAVVDKYTAADIMVTRAPHLIGTLEFMEPPLAKKDFYIGFSKNTKNLSVKLAAFNKSIEEMLKDGTVDQILKKHGLFDSKEKKSDKKTIRIATVNNGDMKIMEKLSTKYEEMNPGVKLEWNVMDENTLRTRLMSSIAISDGKYDIMTIGAFETPIWGEKGWISPITGLEKDYNIEDVIKPVKDILSQNNQLYALPFYGESSMTFYRKDLFEQAGIKMPENPTYDQIMEFASKLYDPSKEIYGIGLRGKAGWGENMAFLTTLVNSFGGRWFDENWKSQIDSQEWNSAISFYKELISKYGPPEISGNGFNENKNLFANGKSAMWIDATVAAGMLYNPKESKVYDKVGFAAAPYSKTPKGSNWLWVWALGIPSSSKNKQEALDFITWATSQEYIELVGEKEGWVSVPPGTRYSTYKNENYLKATPFAEFVLKAMESATPSNPTLNKVPYKGIQYVGIPEFPAIGYQVGEEIVKIFTENADVSKVLKKANELTERQMRVSGY